MKINIPELQKRSRALGITRPSQQAKGALLVSSRLMRNLLASQIFGPELAAIHPGQSTATTALRQSGLA
jgi:hypothetical protein